MTDSTTAVKTCNKCGTTRPLEEFHRSKAYKDGLRSVCKVCAREYARSYNAANAEAKNERATAYRKANTDAINARRRDYRVENLERLSAITRAYRSENQDKVREWKSTYYKSNSEAIREYVRQWREDNPEKIRAHRLANAEKIRVQRRAHYEKSADKRRVWLEANAARTRAYANKRRALKVDMDCGCITPGSTSQVVAAYGDSCVYCGGPNEHIDHLAPLSKGGSHCISNLRPACASCNLSKLNSPLDEFLQRRPDLLGELARQILITCPNQT